MTLKRAAVLFIVLNEIRGLFVVASVVWGAM